MCVCVCVCVRARARVHACVRACVTLKFNCKNFFSWGGHGGAAVVGVEGGRGCEVVSLRKKITYPGSLVLQLRAFFKDFLF